MQSSAAISWKVTGDEKTSSQDSVSSAGSWETPSGLQRRENKQAENGREGSTEAACQVSKTVTLQVSNESGERGVAEQVR